MRFRLPLFSHVSWNRAASERLLSESLLFHEGDGLHAGDFEALAAADVLADHHVVAAKHVGAGFGELGAIALIGTRRKLALLSAHQPGEIVVVAVAAVRAAEP